MLSKIVQESVESAIGKFNAEILNNFQNQGTPEMPIIAYDERVCLIPAMVASSENNKKLLISSQISLLEAELERKKGMIVEIYKENDGLWGDKELGVMQGYNKAIQEDIDYLEVEITKIKAL